jgi:hypothetical protein
VIGVNIINASDILNKAAIVLNVFNPIRFSSQNRDDFQRSAGKIDPLDGTFDPHTRKRIAHSRPQSRPAAASNQEIFRTI